MRVRITHRRPGEVDGVDLSRFEVGLMYDVSPSLATYLIMTGTADPVVDERPALVLPVDEISHATVQPRPPVRERAIAADKSSEVPRFRSSEVHEVHEVHEVPPSKL
jgi:hypothetical protein